MLGDLDRAAEILFEFLLIYFMIMALLAIVYIISYIFRGIGMYTIGKRRGMNSPWLAFVPYARVYFQGELCGTIRLKNREIKSPGIWILVLPIVSNFVLGMCMSVLWSGIVLNVSQWPERPERNSSMMLVIASAAVLVLSLLATTVIRVLEVLVNNQIYSRYTDKNYALAHAVAGIFIPLYTSVYFFIIRNKEKGIYGQKFGYQGPPPNMNFKHF